MVNPELDCIFYLAVNDLCAFEAADDKQRPSSPQERGGFASSTARQEGNCHNDMILSAAAMLPRWPCNSANAWSPCVRLMFNCENHLKHFTAPYWLKG